VLPQDAVVLEHHFALIASERSRSISSASAADPRRGSAPSEAKEEKAGKPELKLKENEAKKKESNIARGRKVTLRGGGGGGALVHRNNKAPVDKTQASKSPQYEDSVYIVKPADEAEGKGIFLCTDVKEIDVTQNYVVQSYIKPLTVSGRKFDMRVYLLITSSSPLTLSRPTLLSLC
jgi:hypothetical protein